MGRAKPVDRLWDRVTSFENVWEAARLARKGKRFRESTARFEQDLGPQLLRLQDELRTGTYEPGRHHIFTIYEPARRMISAAPYRDRVVHHALCQVIEPLFETGFIHDSYANRKGKGTHAALDRVTVFAKRFQYVLQCDIRLFFPSLDHAILGQKLLRRIADREVLELCRKILENSNEQEAAEFYFPGDDLFSPF
jgi:RNA-directed DNA polymerase